jgi:hypothetical protein
MGGVETLVWTHRLRTEFPHLLERPGFMMAEMEPPAVVPERPTNLSEARFQDWRIEVVLDHAA